MFVIRPVAGFLLLCLTACVPAWYARLTPTEKDLWRRCANKVIDAQCGANNSSVYRSTCASPLTEKYSASTDKPKWLRAHGCPPSMVNP